jgi:hypothetical protein
MHQDLSAHSTIDQEESGSQYLPGFRLTHTIHLASVANMDVVSRVAAHLKDQQASVSHFTVLRSGHLLDQKIVLDGIGERQAELLRERLLVLDGGKCSLVRPFPF